MEHAIIIGAGHAGLATAYLLKQKGYNKVVILEATEAVGSAWRKRYAGLTLFTSKRYSALPGMKMEGNADDYPSKQEFVDYLAQYAVRFMLDIKFGCHVIDARKTASGFLINCDNGDMYQSKMLFVCTGAFQMANSLRLNKSSFYQDKLFTPETVGDRHLICEKENWLVIGDGASGRQLAKMLAEKNQVFLATGKARSFLPQRLFGKDIFFWLDKFGLTRLNKRCWLAKRIQKKDPFPANGITNRQLSEAGVRLCQRVDLASLTSDSPLEINDYTIDKVIIATGYYNDFSWLEKCLLSQSADQPIYERASKVVGLYILSQPWLSSRGSALIMGIEHDFNRLHLLKC